MIKEKVSRSLSWLEMKNVPERQRIQLNCFYTVHSNTILLNGSDLILHSLKISFFINRFILGAQIISHLQKSTSFKHWKSLEVHK